MEQWKGGLERGAPILGLTLELRSSRRFPALLLRNLMDGDRSRFLIRLVIVDPSTAIMMRSPRGQFLAQSCDLSQKQHCLPTPQVLPVCPPTDLRWQRPPYLLPSRVCSYYVKVLPSPSSSYLPSSTALFLTSEGQTHEKGGVGVAEESLSCKEMPGPRLPEAFSGRDGIGPRRASGWSGPR